LKTALLSLEQRTLARCKLAKQFEEVGNYEAARETMGDLWAGIGTAPNVEGLTESARAEVLLTIGSLTGWLGSTKQIEGAQQTAKDRIGESIRIFESLNVVKKVAEAQVEMAVCYRREGALDEARVWFREALSRVDDRDGDLKAVALLRSAVLEQLAGRLNDALNLLRPAASLIDASINHTLKGRFHNEFANVLRDLGDIENRADYVDQALIEYAAASVHFEVAGHDRYQACVENNLAMLLFKLTRLQEAYQHLDRADTLFTTLGDMVHQGQVAETRAQFMLAEGALVQAERSARRAVQLLENGDQRSLVAEALTTHGIALSLLHHEHQAYEAFERAIQIADEAGDRESAGLAALALVEQLPERLSDDELFSILEGANERLEKAQNVDLLRRQKECFRRFVSRILWPDLPISLEQSVGRYEARLILRALEATGGVIRQAARLLELSYQGLQKILNNRHSDLRKIIPAIKARARNKLLAKEAVGAAIGKNKGGETRTLRILHVEDDKTVAGIVKEILEDQGWEVDTCADGNVALGKISGEDEYDILLVDYDLPGVNGLEIIKRARELDHRCDTPMVVLAGSPVEAAARDAGADVFLQKPQGIGSLVEAITRLLSEREQDG
jgi:two-component system, OmpR family, response regulator CpxR